MTMAPQRIPPPGARLDEEAAVVEDGDAVDLDAAAGGGTEVADQVQWTAERLRLPVSG